MNLITISSVVAETIPTGMMQVVARWKSSNEKPLAPSNRARAVLLPANIWSSELHSERASDNLQLFIHDAISDLARDYLQTICNESSMLRTEVPLESFKLAQLLQWNADRAALSGRLSGDEIKSWVASSATIKNVAATHGAKIADALGAQFVKLASPNHGLTPDQAGSLLTKLWDASDADSTTGLRVQLRLQSIRDRAQQEDNLLASIL